MPYPRAGSAVDGSKTVHAAEVFRSEVIPPLLSKDAQNVLTHVDGDDWVLSFSDREETVKYKTNDLRMSVVYRARCFKDESESKLYAGSGGPKPMILGNILEKFAKDMVKKGVVKSVKLALDMPRLDFAMLILQTYVKYPLPVDALIPYNYCALGRLMPALKPILNIIC